MKGPEMTTDNPDPLEVWNNAVDAYDERLFGITSPVTRSDRVAAHQAAAAIIAQHYAPLEAENARLREALRAADSLSLHAQTSGGTAGPDAGLIEAIDKYADARTQALGAKP